MNPGQWKILSPKTTQITPEEQQLRSPLTSIYMHACRHTHPHIHVHPHIHEHKNQTNCHQLTWKISPVLYQVKEHQSLCPLHGGRVPTFSFYTFLYLPIPAFHPGLRPSTILAKYGYSTNFKLRRALKKGWTSCLFQEVSRLD